MRDSVQDLTKQVTGKDPFAGTFKPTVVVNHPLAELQNQLVKAEMEQAMLSAKIEAYKKAAANETVISDAIMDNKVEMYPEILQVKRGIVSLQLELQSLDSRSKRGENGRTDTQISQQIQKYQQFLSYWP